jgi:hypothetical protein
MKMSTKLYNSLDSIMPISGGVAGALSQANNILSYFPSWQHISIAIILAVVGAIGGYLTKMLLDFIFKKKS